MVVVALTFDDVNGHLTKLCTYFESIAFICTIARVCSRSPECGMAAWLFRKVQRHHPPRYCVDCRKENALVERAGTASQCTAQSGHGNAV